MNHIRFKKNNLYVENISALANPESLSIFADLREELKK